MAIATESTPSGNDFARPTAYCLPTHAEAVGAVLSGCPVLPVVRAHPQTEAAVARSVARYGGA